MSDGQARHRGTRAVERMVEYAPSTGALALWAGHRDVARGDPHAAPVTTDGRTLFYAPHFERLAPEEQTGWVAHVVLHVALRHVQRHAALRALLGDVDLALFNKCADAVVNSALADVAWLRLPADAPRLDTLLRATLGIDVSPDDALLQWDVESLYRAIDDRGGSRRSGSREARQREPQGSRAERARALGAGQPFDLRPDPRVDGEEAAHPESQAADAREWSTRIARAHAGDGAFSMLRALIADLPGTRTPWQAVLRTRLARALSQRPAQSWSRPARSYIANQGRSASGRRLPWEPGTLPTSRAPRLAVMVDASGSIDTPLLERFATEIDAITRRLEAGLVLVVGDDRVRHVSSFAPGVSRLQDVSFDGGGGTDFTPLLEAADEHRPDIGVVLTDLDGPARFRPRWPVIWAVPPAASDAVPPFGTLLALG